MIDAIDFDKTKMIGGVEVSTTKAPRWRTRRPLTTSRTTTASTSNVE